VTEKFKRDSGSATRLISRADRKHAETPRIHLFRPQWLF